MNGMSLLIGVGTSRRCRRYAQLFLRSQSSSLKRRSPFSSSRHFNVQIISTAWSVRSVCDVIDRKVGSYDAKPECNSKQKRQAAGQLVSMKTLFDSHSPEHRGLYQLNWAIEDKSCKMTATWHDGSIVRSDNGALSNHEKRLRSNTYRPMTKMHKAHWSSCYRPKDGKHSTWTTKVGAKRIWKIERNNFC